MSDATRVVFLVEHMQRPVFHLQAPGYESEEVELDNDVVQRTNRAFTRCGLWTWKWSWKTRRLPDGRRVQVTESYASNEKGITLRRDHAEAFGRICQRCATHEEA